MSETLFQSSPSSSDTVDSWLAQLDLGEVCVFVHVLCMCCVCVHTCVVGILFHLMLPT